MINTILLQKLAANNINNDNEYPRILAGGATANNVHAVHQGTKRRQNYSASGKHFAEGLAIGLTMGQGIPAAYAVNRGILPTGDPSITDVPRYVQRK